MAHAEWGEDVVTHIGVVRLATDLFDHQTQHLVVAVVVLKLHPGSSHETRICHALHLFAVTRGIREIGDPWVAAFRQPAGLIQKVAYGDFGGCLGISIG